MKKSIVGHLNTAITKWSKNHSKNIKLVVAIDGYTGVGKTTVLNHLAKSNKNLLPIYRDDFLISRRTTQRMLKKAKDRSEVFESRINDLKKIKKLLIAFRKGRKLFRTKTYNPASGKIDIPKEFDLSKKALVMEGVFMFHPKLNHLWDKRVYLKGDIKKIDERRVRREKLRWGKDYFPETHPNSYFKQVIIALQRYKKLYKPQQIADLVLNVD